jgi:predicted ArsR family transcriptional regulator
MDPNGPRSYRLLAEIGLGTIAADPTGDRIGLRNCPFLEMGESHTEIICPIHLGVTQGAPTVLATDTTVDRLDPFAEASLCLAQLSTSASA